MGSGVAALAGIPGSIRGGKLEEQAMRNRNAQMMSPEAFDINSMPWVLDQYKDLYSRAMMNMPTETDMTRYRGLIDDQYSLSKMLTDRALSGKTEMTDLQYGQSKDDAISQAMAMAASRPGRSGLAQREIGGLAAGYNQQVARDMAGSRIQEFLSNMNAANQSAGFLRGQETEGFQRAEDSVYRGLGGFYGALENDRQARISREHLKMGQSGIGTAPNPGASMAGLHAGGRAADSGIGTAMSLMSMFGIGLGGNTGAVTGGNASAASSWGRNMGSSINSFWGR